MAKRPIIDKKVNRMVKALRKGRIPAYIDLVKWLKDHDYADTTGQAKRIIEGGHVKADSHVLGTRWALTPEGTKREVFEQFVPANLRERLTCSAPKKKPWL